VSGDPAEVNSSDRLEGYTDNYLRVSLPYDPDLVNTIVPVVLEKINVDGHMTGAVNAQFKQMSANWPTANLQLAN
jgi:hypothetical protein